MNEYKGQGCKEASSLHLYEDGSFVLTITSKNTNNDSDIVDGIWKYRQFPFVELQKEGSAYADHYFEIKTFRDADRVSEIDFSELASLNSGILSEGCSFIFGTRV